MLFLPKLDINIANLSKKRLLMPVQSINERNFKHKQENSYHMIGQIVTDIQAFNFPILVQFLEQVLIKILQHQIK